MFDDLKPYRDDWWDEEIFLGLSRGDLLLVGLIGFVLITIYLPLNYDWVFGLRSK